MKKFVALMLALVMVLALCACGGNSDPKPTDEAKDYSSMTLDQLKAELTTVNEGKLTIATSPDFAPYEFYSVGENGDATLVGFDIAFAKYIADKLGLELEIVPMDFDGTLAELGAKKCDLGMAGYSPDPDRANLMNFSKIYYEGGQCFITSKANADKIKSLDDANNSQYKIGAQTGSIQSKLAKQNTPDADNIDLSKVSRCYRRSHFRQARRCIHGDHRCKVLSGTVPRDRHRVRCSLRAGRLRNRRKQG